MCWPNVDQSNESRTSKSTFWQFSEKLVDIEEEVEVTFQKTFGKRYDHIFPESNTNRPKFRWPNYQNPQIKNHKITKNRFVLKFDLEVVAHSELVQNTSKTPILSISDHISSLKSELPPKNSSWKFWFFTFLRILRKKKSSHWRSF